MESIQILSDNTVTLTGLADQTPAYINDATVVMSLYRKALQCKQQILLPNAQATAGTWTLTYNGVTSPAIAYNASCYAIQQVLDGMMPIRSGDVCVGGDHLNTTPVVGGLTFTWRATYKDVALLGFDFSSLTGPTDAASTMTLKTTNLFKGPAVDKGGGLVGLPIIAHGLAVTDYIRPAGTYNYDAEKILDASSSADEIVITATYAAEVFSGYEQLYVAVPNAVALTVAYVAASDGIYKGTLPDTVKGLREYETIDTGAGRLTLGEYYLFVTATKAALQRVFVAECKAVFE